MKSDETFLKKRVINHKKEKTLSDTLKNRIEALVERGLNRIIKKIDKNLKKFSFYNFTIKLTKKKPLEIKSFYVSNPEFLVFFKEKHICSYKRIGDKESGIWMKQE